MARQKKTGNADQAGSAWAAMGWVAVTGLWLLLVAAMASYDPADPPAVGYGIPNEQPSNWIGLVGAAAAHRVQLMLGPGAWLIVAGIGLYLAMSAIGRRVTQLPLRAAGVLVMAIAASTLLAVGGEAGAPIIAGSVAGTLGGGGQPHGPGGLLALFLADQLLERFAVAGTLVILAVAFWVGALLAADELVLAVPRWIGRHLLGFGAAASRRTPRLGVAGAAGGAIAGVAGVAAAIVGGLGALVGRGRGDRGSGTALRPGRVRRRRSEDEAWDGEPVEDEADVIEEELDDAEDEDEDEEDEEEEDEGADVPETYMATKKGEGFDPEALRAKMRQLPINFAPRTDTTDAAAREPDLSGYQFPGLDLLDEPEANFTEEMEQIVRDQAVELESALQEYRIEGEVVGIDSGPVITMFEVRLAKGTKSSQITAIAADLARALKAQNIRVVPNMAGKNTIGIEVPNQRKEKVRLKELMAAAPESTKKMKLPMYLGKDASGNPLIEDLAAMPHILIAGTTGSGKSVCEASIIMSLLYTRRPDEVKFVLVDPKIVEMSQFKDVPHLMCPPVTEMAKAASILEWAVTRMDERYELLAEAGVRDIASYNSLTFEDLVERLEPGTPEEEAKIPKKLPYIVFIIDELADLMITNKEVENHIVRIAQKARAVGIHLVLATQRPQANVVTGLIKSNLPCRIALKVASGMDSRIVLDQKGGELLLGHGDMLFLSPQSHELMRAQGTLVDDHEIRRTVKFLKSVAQQHFEPQLVQIRSGAQDVDGETLADPLFEKAVLLVIETGRGSVSLLQRRLGVGYGRGARLIEAMAATGILGEYKGTQAREVTISVEEWAAIKAQAEADAANKAQVEAESSPVTEQDEADDAADDDDAYEYEEDEEEDDDAVPDEMEGEYRG
ncbi:MAG: DNA translocase FtsK 4TM domain-containing protein [Phycisphaeraceae bacterium]